MSTVPQTIGWPDACAKTGAVGRFCDAVTALSIANRGNICWWYTWLASRDRFNSELFSVFADPGYDCTRRGNGVLSLLKAFGMALAGWATARFHPGGPPKNVDVILIAPATAPALAHRHNGPYQDTYFGPLLDRLRERGERPLLVGIPVQSWCATIMALAERTDIPAQSIFHATRMGDAVKALWRAYAARLACPEIRRQDGTNLAAHVESELRRARRDIFLGLLIEQATRRLLTRYPAARIIHTYENNPWEHAVDHAAHTDRTRRDVIGYLHCSVLPSHLKNYKAREETNLRPEPDRIVCTGPAARDVFLTLGAHDPSRVLTGCALRGPELTEIVPRSAPPRRISTALVVLEGLPSMVELIRFLAEAAKHLDGRRILLRAHPVMPLDILVQASGVSLDSESGLVESRLPDLRSAIAEADAVIYQSSTAVMTALAMGVPAIKIRLPGPLEDDPLFTCDALKYVVDTPQGLQEAFRHFESMTQTCFETGRDRARSYLNQYLTKADDASLRCFLTP